MPTAGHQFDDVPVSALTNCQRKVVLLIAEGATNQEIAERLGLQRHAVSDHVAQILWRLGATERFEVALWAVRQGLYRGIAS